jgi:hypothetical protein
MKTTVEMAKEAGFTWEPINNIIGPLERFEALVRADEREQSLQREKFIADRWAIECASQVEIEREACAKVCDVLAVHPEYASDITKLAAAAIRARGENP